MGKRGKRGNGEGSIYQRESDGKWCASITVDGKRRTFYGTTRKDVVDKLKKAQRDKDDGLPVITERRTIEQFMRSWLEDSCRHVRPNTYNVYRIMIEHHIIPALGPIELRNLNAQHIQRLLNASSGRLAPKSVALMYVVLKSAMKQATEWGFVARNVVGLVKPPTIPPIEYVTLTPDQTRTLLHHARNDQWEGVYTIAVYLGLRIGEIIALRWQDIDLEAGRLHVRKTLDYKDTLTLQDLKTHHSRRTLPLSSTLITQLRQQRTRQLEQKLKAGPLWEEHDFIFTTDNGMPVHRNRIIRAFKRLLRDAGLPNIRFHDLRHVCATLLASAGVPPRVAMEWLGHSNLRTTMEIYTQVLESSKVDASETLERLLETHKEAAS